MGQKWVENRVLSKNYLSLEFNVGKLDNVSLEFFSKKIRVGDPILKKYNNNKGQIVWAC